MWGREVPKGIDFFFEKTLKPSVVDEQWNHDPWASVFYEAKVYWPRVGVSIPISKGC